MTHHSHPALPAPRPPKSCRSSDRFTSLGSVTPKDRDFLGHVNSLAALMHPPSGSHALPKSGPTLKTSYVVSPVITSGPVRLPLRPSPDHLYVTLSLSGYPPWSRRRPCGPQILPLCSFTACHHHYPGSLAGVYSHFYPASIGLRPTRRGSAGSPPIGGFIPVIRLSQ